MLVDKDNSQSQSQSQSRMARLRSAVSSLDGSVGQLEEIAQGLRLTVVALDALGAAMQTRLGVLQEAHGGLLAARALEKAASSSRIAGYPKA